MTDFISKPFRRELLPELLSLVTSNAISRWPSFSYMMNSDIAWQLPGSNARATLRLWYDGDASNPSEKNIAGYAWLALNAPVTMDLRADLNWDHPIAEDMLVWLEDQRRAYPALFPWMIELSSMQEWEQALEDNLPEKPASQITFQIGSFDKDIERTKFLEAHGYVATQNFNYYMLRSLDAPIPEASLPPGMSLKHVEAKDFPERIATHRDAWFKSSYNMDAYLRLRNIDVYDPELDIVAVSEDGTFGSYCIGWIDEKLGVGSFEPVGTRPEFRRQGLGQQVNYEGLRRMKQKGMSSAKIGTGGFNDRAFGLYSACGFALIDKQRTFIKPDT